MLEKLCTKYLNNISTYNDLENYDYSSIIHKEKVLSILKKNTAEKYKIYNEQNQILSRLRTIINNIDNINSINYMVLKDFAKSLSQSEVEVDNGVAFQIQKFLLSYGLQQKDYNIIIEETLWCGYCEWKYYKIDGKRPSRTYFEKMNDYTDVLDSVSPKARRQYILGIINQLLFYTNKAAGALIAKGQEVLEKLEVLGKKYPDTPINIDALRSIIYRNMITSEKSFRDGIDVTAENTTYIYEIAKKSMALISSKDHTSVPFETVYYLDLYTAEFHAHVIDIDTFLSKLNKLCLPDSQYSVKENYNRIFHNASIYIHYIRKYSSKDPADIQAQIISKVNEVLRFTSRVERNEESHYVSEYILQFIESCIDVIPFSLVKKVLFETTLNQHKETCIHNLMVEKISHIILGSVLKNNPDALIGVSGLQTRDEILKNQKNLLQIMEDMSLTHDIGKYKCLSIISNASKKLDDVEFNIIKQHPVFGYNLIKKANVPDAIKDGVLLHHKWHDGNGGYPAEYSLTNNQPLVDILSVADCLDAATDSFGRSYAVPKTLNEMKAELQTLQGNRYAEFVVDVFNDPNTLAELDHLLTHIRNDMIAYIHQKNYDKVISFYPEELNTAYTTR